MTTTYTAYRHDPLRDQMNDLSTLLAARHFLFSHRSEMEYDSFIKLLEANQKAMQDRMEKMRDLLNELPPRW